MFNRPSFLVTIAVLCGLSTYAFAAGHQDKAKKPKSEPYSIVKVDAEYRVIRKSSLKALRAELSRDYSRAVKEYAAARKEAKKSKVKFEGTKPTKAKLKIVKPTCKNEATAHKYLEALKEKERKKLAKRRGSSRKKRLP